MSRDSSPGGLIALIARCGSNPQSSLASWGGATGRRPWQLRGARGDTALIGDQHAAATANHWESFSSPVGQEAETAAGCHVTLPGPQPPGRPTATILAVGTMLLP